jgi:L-ascorbate metabolism protein UlaG (beta-lactamase superfamily)
MLARLPLWVPEGSTEPGVVHDASTPGTECKRKSVSNWVESVWWWEDGPAMKTQRVCFHRSPRDLPGRSASISRRVAGLMGIWAAVVCSGAEPALTGDQLQTQQGDLIIHPINHATLALGWKDQVIYIDPVGGAKRFAGLPQPTLILITDIHGDHLDAPTLAAVATPETQIIAPKAVADKIPEALRKRSAILSNGEEKTILGLQVEAVPMYNTTPERLRYHEKGRGNGYVLTVGGKRIYVAGDTEDIPEMRALKHIEVAFVPMNLPYTMTVQQAASAVREFKPKVVYPYHCRGSDLGQFKKIVEETPGVEVRLRDWY